MKQFLSFLPLLLIIFLILISYTHYKALKQIPSKYRKISPWLAWLILIPGINLILIWIISVFQLPASFKNYFNTKGKTELGDCGRNLGLAWALVLTLPFTLVIIFNRFMEIKVLSPKIAPYIIFSIVLLSTILMFVYLIKIRRLTKLVAVLEPALDEQTFGSISSGFTLHSKSLNKGADYSMNYCTNCGTKLESEVKFCNKCGSDVSGEVAVNPKISNFDTDETGFDNLSIMDLGEPLFPVVQTDFGDVNPEDAHYSIALMRSQGKVDFQNPSNEYLKQVKKLIKKHPDLYSPYWWLAEYFTVNNRFTDAIEILNSGLSNARIKSFIAFAIGWVNLKQSDPIAIGWYMQSCVLATEQVLPYLLISTVALEVGNENLYWRLFNAKDIVMTGMKRSPNDEAKIKELVLRTDKNELSLALDRFETHMDDYLPHENDIPKLLDSRSIFLGAKWDDYVETARRKLLRL